MNPNLSGLSFDVGAAILMKTGRVCPCQVIGMRAGIAQTGPVAIHSGMAGHPYKKHIESTHETRTSHIVLRFVFYSWHNATQRR